MAPAFASARVQAHNFFRPVAWRWEAALRLAGRRPRKSDQDADPAVLDLTQFLRDGSKPARPGRAEDVDTARVGLPEAICLQDQAGPCRDEVQARLLAGQSDEDVAA